MTFEPPVIDGHRAAIVGEVAATQVGTFMGLPPTGKTIRFRLVFLLDVQDHHIVHDRRIYDFTGLLVQIGVLKAKPV
jgi:predicted ester cyclase